MNNNYKLILATIFSTFLYSCGESINCDGYSEKETLKEVLKESQLEPEMAFAYQMLGIKDMEAYLDHFYDDVVKLDLVRTTDLNKEIKKCDCSAKLMFELDPKIKNYIDQNTKGNSFQSLIKSAYLSEKGINIDYSVQEINNGEFIVETYIPEELTEVIIAYYMIEKGYEENNKVTEVEEPEESENYEVEEATELEENQNNKTLPQNGIINGTNVVFRDNHSTKSNIIGSFTNKGERVELLEKFKADNKNQGLISREIKVEIDNKTYNLGKDKAITIIEKSNGLATISFSDVNQVTRITKISENSITEIQNDDWFKVKRENGKIGWVFGKFITLE